MRGWGKRARRRTTKYILFENVVVLSNIYADLKYFKYSRYFKYFKHENGSQHLLSVLLRFQAVRACGCRGSDL